MIGDLFGNPVFREADLVKLADDHTITRALSTDRLVCLHGADAFSLTALALTAALDVASQGQKTVYIASEGQGPLAAMLARLGKARHLGVVKGLFVLPIAVDLLQTAKVEALTKIIAQKVGQPDLIVFDCLAFCFGADERNPEAMKQFVDNLHALEARTGARVLLLHRTGLASVRGIHNTAAPPQGMALVELAA